MRHWLLLAGILLVVPLSFPASGDTATEGGVGSGQTEHASERKPLGVEQLMKAVDDYQGEVVLVEGIVSAVMPEERIVALIDVEEFEQCGVTTCAAYTLPVSWAGELPSVEDHVRIEGEVRESDGKLVFAARGSTRVNEPAKTGK